MRVDNAIKSALSSTELESLVLRFQSDTVRIPVQLHLGNDDEKGFHTGSGEKGTLELPKETLLRIMAGTKGKVATTLDIEITSVHELMAMLASR